MRRIALVVATLLVLTYLSTGLAMIRPGERAVVRRFGRVLPTKPAPGLWLGLPWPVDRVDRVPITLVRRLAVGYEPDAADPSDNLSAQLLTGDHNLVDVGVVLHYAVKAEDEEIVHYVLNQDRIDGLLSRVVQNCLAEWVAGRRIDELLVHGKTDLPRALDREVPERIADYELGIRIEDINVSHLAPPEEVKSAFDEVTRAQAAIQTGEYRAQQEAARTVREAEGRKYTRVQQALGYADTQRRLAYADARRFDERRRQYWTMRAQNPDVLATIWWDEIGRLFNRMKETGRLDLLDHHLGTDGLDITTAPMLSPKR